MNQLYVKGKEGYLGADITMDTGNIVAVLTRDAYNATHEFASDLSDIVATSSALASKSITNGTFDSADPVFTAVGAGAAINYIVLYEDKGTLGTSRLIAHIDTASSGLPVTPDGTDITVEVNASGWFTL